MSLQFNLKSNDLYHFYQTKDLISATVHPAPRQALPKQRPDTWTGTQSPALRELREVLYSEAFVRLIGTIAGVTLNRNMDMSGHRYPPAVRPPPNRSHSCSTQNLRSPVSTALAHA